MVGVAQGLIGSLKSAEALPAGTILIFDRTTLATPLPSGWSALTSIAGNPVEGFAIKASSSVSRNLETAATFSTTFPSIPSAVGTSAHNYAATTGPTPGPGVGGTYVMSTAATPAGAHSHVKTGPTTTGPHRIATPAPAPGPAIINQVGGVNVPLITNSATQAQVPANAIVFCGTASIFSGFSRKLWPALAPFTSVPDSCGLYSVAPEAAHVVTSIHYPTGQRLTGPTGGVIGMGFIFGPFNPAGAHFHGPGTLGLGPGPFPSPRRRAYSSPPGSGGTHSHNDPGTILIGDVKYWKQFTHITPTVSTTNQDVVSGMIVMYNSGVIPAGWLLCNGTSGTPNLTNQFIGFDNIVPSTSTPLVIGADQIGQAGTSPDAPPFTGNFIKTPAPSATTRAGNWFADFNSLVGAPAPSPTNWPHTHPTPSPTSIPPTTPLAVNTGGHEVGFGIPNTHSHTVSANTPTTRPTFGSVTQYQPRNATLVFIQKA